MLQTGRVLKAGKHNVQKVSFSRGLLARTGLAVLGGLTWAAAFPSPGWAGMAWVAPGLMLAAALGASPQRAFGLGYIAGIVHHLVSLHWLVYNPFPAGAAAGWLALSAYLASYPAVWLWLCARAMPTADESRAPAETSREGKSMLGSLAASVADACWAQRVRWCIACAALWVGLEMCRARLFTGFPWNLLGVSQQPLLPLVQLASATGVYGISFLVVWGSASLFCAGAKLVAQVCQPAVPDGRHELKTRRFRPVKNGQGARLAMMTFRFALLADVGLPLIAVLTLTFVGGARLMRRPPQDRELKLALVQPAIPQRLIFDPRESTNRFEALMKLTELALASEPDLLVWPEASLPSLEMSQFHLLTNTVAARSVWMIFGADDAVRRAGPETDEQYDYFNSAFLFDPHGRYVAAYRKRHLVIFGEYIPLERWLPFMRHLTPVQTSFTPGMGPVRFELDSLRAVTSVLICFEDVVPHLVREYVDPDTDFLLNLTNDAWFGQSAAQWQHALNAAFRAVENGLPLVRCTNNGLTCWIDACGRLRDVGFGSHDDIYAPGFKLVHVPLLESPVGRTPTIYRQYGDWFGWACALLAALAAVGRHLHMKHAVRRHAFRYFQQTFH